MDEHRGGPIPASFLARLDELQTDEELRRATLDRLNVVRVHLEVEEREAELQKFALSYRLHKIRKEGTFEVELVDELRNDEKTGKFRLITPLSLT